MSLATRVGLDAPAAVGFGEKIWRINWGLAAGADGDRRRRRGGALLGGGRPLRSVGGAACRALRRGLRPDAGGGADAPTVWLALAWPIYIVSLLLLVAVDVVGKTGMGAQRWLMLGPMQIQPSEITKVAVILVLARYYHGLSRSRPRASSTSCRRSPSSWRRSPWSWCSPTSARR